MDHPSTFAHIQKTHVCGTRGSFFDAATDSDTDSDPDPESKHIRLDAK